MILLSPGLEANSASIQERRGESRRGQRLQLAGKVAWYVGRPRPTDNGGGGAGGRGCGGLRAKQPRNFLFLLVEGGRASSAGRAMDEAVERAPSKNEGLHPSSADCTTATKRGRGTRRPTRWWTADGRVSCSEKTLISDTFLEEIVS